MRASSWWPVCRRAMRGFIDKQCIDSASSLTYFAFLSIFPAILAMLSLFGLFGWRRQATDALLSIIRDLAPPAATEAVRDAVDQVTGSSAVGFAFVGGIVVALWTASGYIGAFSRAMNRIRGVRHVPPYWRRKPVQLLITLVAVALMLVVVTVLVVSGPVLDAVGNALGVSAAAKLAWSVVKWPVLAAAIVLMIVLLYYATPDVRERRFRWFSPGALLALALIVVASGGFGIYVANFSHYNQSYGSVAGIVFFLVWMWLANLALLFGAEFDMERERTVRAIGGGAATSPPGLPRESSPGADRGERNPHGQASV